MIDKEKVISFFKSEGLTNCTIMYRIYEYGKYCRVLSFEEAVSQFIKDYEEMKEFLSAYIPDISNEQVFQKVVNIWKRHLILRKK